MINGRRVVDIFPFFNELDVLEIRLNELDAVVDTFVIAESNETYGGDRKPLYLADNWNRFRAFHGKIQRHTIERLLPQQSYRLDKYAPGNISEKDIRTIGREREKNQRDQMYPFVKSLGLQPNDIIMFSDCDEIPSSKAVASVIPHVDVFGIHRFKQHTYYYNVNCLVDYGRDICSRARIGTYANLQKLEGSLYNFRMAGNKVSTFPAVEEGGWHFSYFGGTIEKLKEKVAALSPFLVEYQLFGDRELVNDIINRRDLHHRSTRFSELSEVFQLRPSDDPSLPVYYLKNRERFQHFTLDALRARYERR